MNWKRLFIVTGCLLFASPALGQEQKPDQPQPKKFLQKKKALNPAQILKRFDKDNDGYLDKSEFPERMKQRFEKMDLNNDKKISIAELREFARKGKGGRPGEVNTPPAKGERHQDTLKAGDAAPDFTLPLISGKGQMSLSSFKGKRPVVLIFASYT